MASEKDYIDLLETFIADAYWTYGINSDIWDSNDEYERVHQTVLRMKYPKWNDNWLSEIEKESADEARRSLGQLPYYGYPTLEDYERLAGIA